VTVRGTNDERGDFQLIPGDYYDDSGGESEENENIGRLMFAEEVHIEG
jgi:hypothetical protein